MSGATVDVTLLPEQQYATQLHARRCSALAAAVQQGVFSDASPSAAVRQNVFSETQSAMFMDMDAMHGVIDELHAAGYPAGTLHTVAVKANPIGKVLEVFKDRHMGAEVASIGELAQALHVGFPKDKIVFDSPAKTVSEIEFALKTGVRMNLDSFQELERTAAIIAAHPEWLGPSSMIGLRVNPQIGAGSIAALSTGGLISKFGIPLTEARQQLVEAFKRYPWLNMLHLHVGSQGLPTSRIIDGVERVWQLLEEVDAACGGGRVKVLDIGGGLTVDFNSDQPPQISMFREQADMLRTRIPGLFQQDRSVQLVTENGRSLLAKAGFVASRVEATKCSGGRHIAVTHIGADLLMRSCYLPETWPLRLFICDPSGSSKEAAAGPLHSCSEGDASSGWVEQDIAGPLCFQGDRLAVGKLLPKTCAGDFVMVVDVGAVSGDQAGGR